MHLFMKANMAKLPTLCTYLLFLLALDLSHAMRVLVVFPMFSKSHNILGQGVVNNLLEAGHEVVFMTSFVRSKPVQNLTEIDCSECAYELKKQSEKSQRYKLKNLVGKSNIADSTQFMFFIAEYTRVFLEYEPVKSFLSDPKEKFDLVIIEWFFSQAMAGIPSLFGCPFIWIGSTEVHGHILRVIDEVPNPAYSADLFSTSSPPFSFWERAVELVTAFRRHFIVNFVIGPYEKSIYDGLYPAIAAKRGVPLMPYEEAAYNASMILVNSHPTVGTPFKLPQNVKYIGGYHIDRKTKPMPEHIQSIFDESEHGVIYFSMGSNLQSKHMTTEMKESLLKMFGELKEDVIWKFEDDLENAPANVHLVQWAPQTRILAHPKLKLFITHGGQLSLIEAIHFGVPLVGLPMFGDQYLNMQSVVKKGFGVMLQVKENFAYDLKAAVEKVLGNSEYKKRAQFLSSVYHDRLATPGEELVYWAEHVVKTNGALHLRSPAFMVSWYQKMYLDLVALLILLVIAVFTIAKVTWKSWRSRNVKKNKKN